MAFGHKHSGNDAAKNDYDDEGHPHCEDSHCSCRLCKASGINKAYQATVHRIHESMRSVRTVFSYEVNPPALRRESVTMNFSTMLTQSGTQYLNTQRCGNQMRPGQRGQGQGQRRKEEALIVRRGRILDGKGDQTLTLPLSLGMDMDSEGRSAWSPTPNRSGFRFRTRNRREPPMRNRRPTSRRKRRNRRRRR